MKVSKYVSRGLTTPQKGGEKRVEERTSDKVKVNEKRAKATPTPSKLSKLLRIKNDKRS